MHVWTSCSSSMEHFLTYIRKVVPVLPTVVYVPSDSEVALQLSTRTNFMCSARNRAEAAESTMEKTCIKCEKEASFLQTVHCTIWRASLRWPATSMPVSMVLSPGHKPHASVSRPCSNAPQYFNLVPNKASLQRRGLRLKQLETLLPSDFDPNLFSVYDLLEGHRPYREFIATARGREQPFNMKVKTRLNRLGRQIYRDAMNNERPSNRQSCRSPSSESWMKSTVSTNGGPYRSAWGLAAYCLVDNLKRKHLTFAL